MYDWSQHIIGEDASLVDALEQLNKLSGQTMVLFVVDADGKMTGTLTDGDIRRFLIREKRSTLPHATSCTAISGNSKPAKLKSTTCAK